MTQSNHRNSISLTDDTTQLNSNRFLRLHCVMISKKTFDELSDIYNEAIDRINDMNDNEDEINEDLYDLNFTNRFATIQYLFMKSTSGCGTLSDIISELSILFKEDLFELQNEDSDIKTFFINMLKMPKTCKWKDIFARKDIFYTCELLFTEPDAKYNTIMDEMLEDLEFFLKAGYIGTIAKRVIISSSPTKFTKNDEPKKPKTVKGETKNA